MSKPLVFVLIGPCDRRRPRCRSPEASAPLRRDEGPESFLDSAAVDDAVRVFLLDDHEVVRRGLRDLLESAGGIEVVGEAGTADEALRRIPPTAPDVAILDVRLPDGNGVEVCRDVRSQYPDV